jgi:serine/threonine protein kinase
MCFYRGAAVENGFVYGLMFDRYDMTLQEFVEAYDLSHDILARCLSDIDNGIRHIHAQGLVHCDIKPDNIFVDLTDECFVVGDFDSVQRQDTKLRLKCGTEGWVPNDEDTKGIVRASIDWYSLAMIRCWLEMKMALGRNSGQDRDKHDETTKVLADFRRRMLEEDSQPGAAVPVVQQVGDDSIDTSW